MKGKSYTFFIASSASGGMRRMRVPFYVLHGLTLLAVVGGITIPAGMGSYSRMLWKAANYNSLRRDQDNLKHQFVQLQTQVKDTNQRLSSLQSLAGEVAVAYGINRFARRPLTWRRQILRRTGKGVRAIARSIQLLASNVSWSVPEQWSAALACRAVYEFRNCTDTMAGRGRNHRTFWRAAGPVQW